jgi:hypothetical protein
MERYKLLPSVDSTKTDGSIVFKLQIVGVENADNGDIICSVKRQNTAETRLKKTLIVKSMPTTIKVEVKGEVMADGSQIDLDGDESLPYTCHVSGGYPEAEVTVMIGDRDVTTSLAKDSKIEEEATVIDGLVNKRAMTHLTGTLSISSYDHDKKVVCEGKTPGVEGPSVKSSVTLHFLQEPVTAEFVECEELVVVEYLTDDVVIKCSYTSSEAPKDVKVSFPVGISNPGLYKETAEFETPEGHKMYNATEIIQHGARKDWDRHDNEKRVTTYGEYELSSQWMHDRTEIEFKIERVQRQMFRPYTITVVRGENDEDSKTITLKMDLEGRLPVDVSKSWTARVDIVLLIAALLAAVKV